MNDQLSTQLGQAPGQITLDMANVQPPTGRSGLVPDGNFELETVAVKTDRNKRGDGFNFVYTDRVVGPSGNGTTIITVHPAPVGDPGSKALKDGTSFCYSRATAYYSALGKDPAALKRDGVNVDWSKFCTGKSFFAALKHGEGDYADRSQIDMYLTKAQFAAAPGPRAGSGNNAARQAAPSASPLDEAMTASPQQAKPAAQAAPDVLAMDI